MSSDAELRAFEDTLPLAPGHVGERDAEWPIAELYRVESAARRPAEIAATDASTVVVTQDVAARQRLLPLIALFSAGLIAGLILLVALLGVRHGDTTATARRATIVSDTAPLAAGGATSTKATASRSKELVTIDDVEDTSLESARRSLEKEGFRVRVLRLTSDRPRGEIMSQVPLAGTKVGPNVLITLVVSAGKTSRGAWRVRVPGVEALAVSDAVAALRDAGFEPHIRLVASSRPAGTVIRQAPAQGTRAARSSSVALDVARVRPVVQRVDVPDVAGTNATSARRLLRSAGLTVKVVSVASEQAAGTVVAQSPRGGSSLRAGATVTLRVSSGPPLLVVPDVTGLDEQSATSELEDAGFRVRVSYEVTTDPTEDGIVLDQDPVGRLTAEGGSVVTLTVARID